MAYYIRTNTGIMVAKVDNVVAGCLMRHGKGEWAQRKSLNSTKTVYVFSGDFTYGDEIMKLCIWEGFYLDKVN